MQLNDYTEANRKSWNERALIHEKHLHPGHVESFKTPGYSTLDKIITGILEEIGLNGKTVAQICCNNGREVLSIRNLGADNCVGFDISDNYIEQARQINSAASLDCEFVRTNIYEIPDSYNEMFDLAFISIGTLGWMPDILEFFSVVNRILKTGGTVAIYETHPVAYMYDEEKEDDPLKLTYSYFDTEPFEDQTGYDSYTKISYERQNKAYWFTHTLSDIFEACIDNDLNIKSFKEYDQDISGIFKHLENMNIQLPLSFTLVAQRNYCL